MKREEYPRPKEKIRGQSYNDPVKKKEGEKLSCSEQLREQGCSTKNSCPGRRNQPKPCQYDINLTNGNTTLFAA
jgi:hypothetical protein